MQISYKIYNIATFVFLPLIKLWLRVRLLQGKENKARFSERFGLSRLPRPQGTLLWIHAASVGEVNSVWLLIEKLQERFPDVHILLTTGTVTSAQLVEKRQLKNVIHQFVPVDTMEATTSFLRHWKPDVGFWVESELWPNLVMNARKWGCFMVIINGRMSVKSYLSWQNHALLMIFNMLNCFELVFAQSEDDGQRFRALGAKEVRFVGNLKYDAEPLTCREVDLFALQQEIGNRPVWLAASTHDNEEEQLIATHRLLATKHSEILTIIAPRHPSRGAEIEKTLSACGKVALRSRADKIKNDTNFYVADTLGELGLFYRLSEIVFMGGSLIPHGGQNPLEPTRLRSCVLTGEHTHNFSDMYAEMEKLGICIRVRSAGELAGQIEKLMENHDLITQMQMLTREWLRVKSGAADKMIEILSPIFAPAAAINAA